MTEYEIRLQLSNLSAFGEAIRDEPLGIPPGELLAVARRASARGVAVRQFSEELSKAYITFAGELTYAACMRF